MDFRLKCLMQVIFGMLPGSENLNFLAQKYLTKSLPRSRGHYEVIYNHALMHHSVFERHGIGKGAVVYEIGCGWELSMALVFSTLGYSSVLALDTVCHARRELINGIIGYMREDGLIDSRMTDFDKSCDIKERLLRNFGIKYLAPCDSADTGLEEGSIDCIYSHLVFEHIAPDRIPAILEECGRVLKDGGVMSLVIDYADHYRTFDKSITPYNFLRYSEKSWKKYNPGLQYVNRLRHRDFIELFTQAGFVIAGETVFKPGNAEEIVRDFPFADEFRSKYTPEELSITDSRIVLKKTE